MPVPNIIKWFWYRHRLNWSGRENAQIYWKAPPPAPNIFIFTVLYMRIFGTQESVYVLEMQSWLKFPERDGDQSLTYPNENLQTSVP
jgi:hypothetical protein